MKTILVGILTVLSFNAANAVTGAAFSQKETELNLVVQENSLRACEDETNRLLEQLEKGHKVVLRKVRCNPPAIKNLNYTSVVVILRN